MKTILATGFIFSLLFSMNSCTESNETEDTSENVNSTYSYNEASTTLEWISYKTNDTIPVAGGFNEVVVTSTSSDNPKEVIESIQFSINTASVETNNEERNKKIASLFFGTINTPSIEGAIQSLKDDGTATVMITMNGISFDIDGEYTLEENTFSFSSRIDLMNWNGMPGIEALNAECEELHKGKDGISKLWSEVALNLSTTLDLDSK